MGGAHGQYKHRQVATRGSEKSTTLVGEGLPELELGLEMKPAQALHWGRVAGFVCTVNL